MRYMKQKKLHLIIGIISLIIFQAGSLRAEESNEDVADATLSAYEIAAVPPDQQLGSLPRWRSSLGEIQQAAAVLLETNSKLNGEARQLQDGIDALQMECDRRRVENARISDEIVQERNRAQENSDAVHIARLKEILADRSEQFRSQKQELAQLKERYASINNRTALARLRVAGLEVEKKSMAVNVKLRDEAAVNAARARLQGIRDKIVTGERQVTMLEQKTLELNRVENPYILRTREVAARNLELKERVTAMQAKKAAQRADLEKLAAEKFKVDKDPNMLRVKKLLIEREALAARLQENSVRLETLKDEAIDQMALVPAVVADMDKLQKQNTLMEEVIANLRENVALLEYKVTTLQRYKDRNKAIPKTRP